MVAPLTDRRFRIAAVQTDRIIIEFADTENSRTLPRDQFEALHERITTAVNGFTLNNLPQGTEPYAAVLSLHPRYEVDESAGVIRETEDATTTQVVDESDEDDPVERTEPDLEIYSDALLLIDALERHDPSVLEDVETPALINLYTLLSDVQRDANDLRKEVSEVLLDRVHHDQPVHGQFGSVQRTTRRRRTLKNDEEVLATLEDAGIPRERVLGVDRDKVDEALHVLELFESAVCCSAGTVGTVGTGGSSASNLKNHRNDGDRYRKRSEGSAPVEPGDDQRSRELAYGEPGRGARGEHADGTRPGRRIERVTDETETGTPDQRKEKGRLPPARRATTSTIRCGRPASSRDMRRAIHPLRASPPVYYRLDPGRSPPESR